MAAAVQGMDQTVINGANLFFPKDFGISEETERNTWLLGLVNSAPYLCWYFHYIPIYKSDIYLVLA